MYIYILRYLESMVSEFGSMFVPGAKAHRFYRLGLLKTMSPDLYKFNKFQAGKHVYQEANI